MKVKNNSFPYPVLSNFSDDYHSSLFDLDVEVKNEFNQLYLYGTFKLENDGLNTLIDLKSANYLIHIECPQTTYRTTFVSETNTFKQPIESDKIKGKLEINGFIVARDDIEEYINDSFDEMYEGLTFKINKGNILAVSDRIDAVLFESDDDYQDMSSIINIRMSETEELMKIENESDKIIIVLPKNAYLLYAEYAKTDFKEVIITNVIFPALIYVFSLIENNKNEYDDTRWYQVLKEVLEQSGVDIEKIGNRGEPGYIIVQKLLHNPVMKSLEAIKLFSNQGDE